MRRLNTDHRPPGFLEGRRVVLTVGRLAANERYKGVDTLIQTLPRLLPNVPDLHLVVVGDGDDRTRLEAMAREDKVSDRAHFLGRLSQDELLAKHFQARLISILEETNDY